MSATPPPPGMEDFVASAPAAPVPTQTIAAAAPPPGMADFVAPELSELKYGSLPQQALTALESGASALTFGGSKGIERKLGVKPADILGRENENPVTSMGGAVGALGLASLIPVYGEAADAQEAARLAQLGVKAGTMTAAEAAPAIQAAKLAINPLSASSIMAGAGERAAMLVPGTQIGSRLAAGAVKAGVEGMIFQGGNEVGKMLLSDPEQTVGTAAANIGLAGLIGGGIGAGTSGAGALWEAKFGPKVANALDNASSELTGDHVKLPDDYYQKNMILDGISTPKPNLPQILDAANELGIKELPLGTGDGNQFVQTAVGNLKERPTIPGVSVNKGFEETYGVLNKAAQETLRDATEKTELQVGKEIKEGMLAKLNEELKPLEGGYNKLKPHFDVIEVPPELKSNAAESIRAHEFTANSPYAKQADSIAEDIADIKNLTQLKNYRTQINGELNKAYMAGDTNTVAVLQKAKNALTDLRVASIEDAAAKSGIGKESSKIALETIDEIKALDESYAKYKAKLKQLGVETGLGKVNSARGLLDRMAKVADESLPRRFFNPDDVGQMQYLKENFPEQFDLARRFKLKEIRDGSISQAQGKNGRFEIGSYLTKLKDSNIGPEARDMLFNGNQTKINNIKTIYQAMPGTPNTSHTSYAESFAKMLSPAGLMQNATDAVQLAMLRALPHLKEAMSGTGSGAASELAALKFASQPTSGVKASSFKAMVDYIAQTIKGNTALNSAAKDLFESGKVVLPSKLIPDQESRDSLDKKLKDLQSNNSGLMHSGDQVGHYLPEHAMALSQTTASAVSYLNSIRPNVEKRGLLDTQMEPNAAQKYAYAKALNIAQSPLIVLTHIKDGTIDPHDVMTIKTIYPALYHRMSEKITHHMADTIGRGEVIPYKTRLGLSLFLGQPLDSTMTPEAIMATQLQMVAPQQHQGGQKSQHHSMKGLDKLVKSDMTPTEARIRQRSGRI